MESKGWRVMGEVTSSRLAHDVLSLRTLRRAGRRTTFDDAAAVVASGAASPSGLSVRSVGAKVVDWGNVRQGE
jgi:hypothetical protein